MAIDIKLPHLGENIEAGQVVKVFVKVGDHVEKNQNILELETDKASIEIPVDVAGTVKKIHVKEGDTIPVDAVFLTVEEAASAQPTVEKTDEAVKKDTKDTGAVHVDLSPSQLTPSYSDDHDAGKSVDNVNRPKEFSPPPRTLVPAAPSTRRFAREIGIDITQVSGSGPGGRISIADVKDHSKQLNRNLFGVAGSKSGTKSLPDFAKWGDIRVESLSHIRTKTAENLSYSWATIPHVTQFHKADITKVEQQRRDLAHLAEAAGAKLTITAIILKIVAAALRKFPRFNASLDIPNNVIIYKDYYHIGVAVDTDRGLIVPVIRDVDRKNILTLCVELAEVADLARKKKTSLDEMQGGTFTVSNLGGIGGTSFTPIVKWPEVAILGVARSTTEATYVDGEFVPRLMIPLALSYDHRVIDGADGARFLQWIVTCLENPLLMALQ